MKNFLKNIYFYKKYVIYINIEGVAQLVRALACHARGRGGGTRHSRFKKYN